MFSHDSEVSWDHLLMVKRWAVSVALILFPAWVPTLAHAQGNFNSGSTGADGAFAPTANQTIQLPESGVFNFTTVNIPAGVEIKFRRNAKNTPVAILATGNVTIAGTINIEGAPGVLHGGGVGGAGGFNGGTGGYGSQGLTSGLTGDGPGGGGGGDSNRLGGGGGGHATAGGDGEGNDPNFGRGGPRYGTGVLVPLIGGSGGGGGGGTPGNNHAGAGGGGGGAILIASSGAITFNGGRINARGGAGSDYFGNPPFINAGGGGGGAGGAIRLVANTITGTASLDVSGGVGGEAFFGSTGGRGASGYIRVEAFDINTLSPITSPSAVFSLAQPKPAVLPNAPQLRIVSIAGIAAPAAPLGSLTGTPDIIVPTTQANPVTIAIQGANIPVGTLVQVTLIPETGARRTVDSTPLAGTTAASTATASVTLPAIGMSIITATTTIELTASLSPIFIDNERVARIEVAATYGGKSEVTYITQSGRRISQSE